MSQERFFVYSGDRTLLHDHSPPIYRKICLIQEAIDWEGDSELCDKRRKMVMMVSSSAIGYVGEIREDRQCAGVQ